MTPATFIDYDRYESVFIGTIRVGTLMRSPTGAPVILPAGGGMYTRRPWGEWVFTVGSQTVTVTVPTTLRALEERLAELQEMAS